VKAPLTVLLLAADQPTTLHRGTWTALDSAVGLAVGSCNWRCDAPEKLITIHKAHTPQPSGTIAVLGPGTGLGSCFGVWDSSASSAAGPPELQIFPSEGGESDFVPRSDLEWGLRQHLATTLGTAHVKVGLGLGLGLGLRLGLGLGLGF